MIEVLHNEQLKQRLEKTALLSNQSNLAMNMKQQLPPDLYQLLQKIGKAADEFNVNAYMIGGIVRDLILERENDDIDVVIEGDGIAFAKFLVEKYGGEVKIHESFGTSTWTHPNGTLIDITTSRFEYYDHPAALPTVEHSNLREDLYRRDFTINAMAIQLNEPFFGEIIDFFNGREHLARRTIKVLHNLSFVEDPTRILRAVRFETRFDFKMDNETLDFASRSMDKMTELSKTRISNELHKLFTEDRPLVGLQRLFELEFWSTIIQDLSGEAIIMNHGRKLHDTLDQYDEYFTQKDHQWFFYMMLPFYQTNQWLELVSEYALNRKEIKLAEEIDYLRQLWPTLTDKGLSDLHPHLKKISNDAILFFISHPAQVGDYKVAIEYVRARKSIPQLVSGEDLKTLGVRPSLDLFQSFIRN